MSETNQNENLSCSVCGNPVINIGTGGIAHSGGGEVSQRCSNCGWSGGQVERYVECPRCGDGTQLVDDHTASI